MRPNTKIGEIMKKALIPAILGAGLIVSTPAHAAYGPAGCGWGHQFIDKEGNATGLKGAIAVIANGIFANQFFSVLLNTATARAVAPAMLTPSFKTMQASWLFNSHRVKVKMLKRFQICLVASKPILLLMETPTTCFSRRQ